VNDTKPVRCPDCIGAPLDHVSEFGHLILDPERGTVLVPHTGCPNRECRHGEWSHDPEVGCTARWFAGEPPGCPCLLGPDWATATVWSAKV
jgi:hypothetical protein